MCVTHFSKFEEDWTEIVIAIVDERFVPTHRYTDIHSSDFISVQYVMNCIGQTIITLDSRTAMFRPIPEFCRSFVLSH